MSFERSAIICRKMMLSTVGRIVSSELVALLSEMAVMWIGSVKPELLCPTKWTGWTDSAVPSMESAGRKPPCVC